MQIGKAIKSLINSAGYNCYFNVIPSDITDDAIVYTVISDVPTTSKGNTSHIDTYRVQLNIFSTDMTRCMNLAGSIRTALDGKSGSYGGLSIDSITFIDQGSDYDYDQNEYMVRQDYYVRQKL